jgi:ribosome-binding factor A
MPKEFSRNTRIADQIQRSLAQMIQMNVSDPRVGMVNVNGVEVARDYSIARIFVTFIRAGDGDEDKANNDAIAVLNNASAYLRTLLAKTLNSRTTPRLMFVLDTTTLRGQKLSHLIDKAIAADRNHSDE